MSISPTFSKLEVHPKIWGEELWITNNSKYCGKILRFKKDASFSMHYHIIKEETWLVSKGKLLFDYFDLEKAEKLQKELLELQRENRELKKLLAHAHHRYWAHNARQLEEVENLVKECESQALLAHN